MLENVPKMYLYAVVSDGSINRSNRVNGLPTMNLYRVVAKSGFHAINAALVDGIEGKDFWAFDVSDVFGRVSTGGVYSLNSGKLVLADDNNIMFVDPACTVSQLEFPF